MKFTVMITERHAAPWCSGVLDYWNEAVDRMNALYKDALKFEGLSDEEIQEALDRDLGNDRIDANESLGSGTLYRVVSINEGKLT